MLQNGVGWTTSSSTLGTSRSRSLTDLHQLRHQLFHLFAPLRQLFHGRPQPQPRRPPHPQLFHRFPQASWRCSSLGLAPLSGWATADTASRMAASRSETPTSSEAEVCKPVGWSLAALGAVEPSNNEAPTAPTGMIPDRTLRYFSRRDITTPHDRLSIRSSGTSIGDARSRLVNYYTGGGLYDAA